MIIQLASLPSTVLAQIPFSLKYNKTSLDYATLPNDMQLLLHSYTSNSAVSHTLLNVFDFKPVLSEYGDLQEIVLNTDLIVEYIQNWFKIHKGSYPFDPKFGTILQDIVHTKDTMYQKQLLKNEMKILNRLIQQEFGTTFSVIKQSIVPYQLTDRTEYVLELQIKILGRNIGLSVTTN